MPGSEPPQPPQPKTPSTVTGRSPKQATLVHAVFPVLAG